MNKEKSHLSQLVLTLCSQTGSNCDLPQDQSEPTTIRVNQIITKHTKNDLTYWNTKSQTQSQMQCYLALKRQYTVAAYLTTVTDVKHRKMLTKYRLSAHSLAIETGR